MDSGWYFVIMSNGRKIWTIHSNKDSIAISVFVLWRLWWIPESGFRIFEEPQLSENWLQLTFFDGLALPHMSINFWICFWCILFTFQQRRRTFPPAFLFCQLPQIWEKTPIGLHKRLNFGKHSHWSAQNWSTNRNVFPNLRHWERCSVLGG